MNAIAPATRANPFEAFVARYYHDRVGFVREILRAEPQPWQEEALSRLDKGETRLSIRSGHGVGKTAFLSWTLLHFVLTRFPSKAVATASAGPQLFDGLAAETKKWLRKLEDTMPAFKGILSPLSDRIDLAFAPESAFISFRTARMENPEALQGVHSENVLLIADEASGVPDVVFEAAGGSMSTHGAITILTGNPTRASGFFYATHTKLADIWSTMRVGCDVSTLVTQQYIDSVRLTYGELSNAYRVRVLGEFPVAEDDTLIARHIVDAAVNRDVALVQPQIRPVWGLDVARFGDAVSALAKRQSNHLLEPVRAFRGLDLMQLCGAIQSEFQGTPDPLRPTDICVDVIGLGAGVVDRLREMGLPVVGINVSEAPAFSNNNAAKLRDELWLSAREWFTSREVRIPDDQPLVRELCMPRVTYLSTGKTKVEGKSEMRQRGEASPDRADAFCLTFAGMAGRGSGGSRIAWSKPLRRGLNVV
jgi:phage terminase large subunit